MRFELWRAASLLTGVLLFAQFAQAQIDTGAIVDVVRDPSARLQFQAPRYR